MHGTLTYSGNNSAFIRCWPKLLDAGFYLIKHSGQCHRFFCEDTGNKDAFGNVLSRTGSSLTQKGFASDFGYQEDGESGLKLLGHRYYDPETGRFISRDRARYGRNWYGYCENNPLAYVDPTGFEEKGYDSPGEAATAAAQEWTEKDVNNEHAGEIYCDPNTGKYYYTLQFYPDDDAQKKAGAPRTYDTKGSSYVSEGKGVPAGCKVIGSWHTHPETDGVHKELVNPDGTKGRIDQTGTKEKDGPSPGDEAAMRRRSQKGQRLHDIALGTGDVVEYFVMNDGKIIPKVVGKRKKDK